MRCTATAYAVADARHQRVDVFGVDGRGSVIWPFNGPACGQSGQLGDALTYGLSLYVVSRNRMAKARVAMFKGGLIFAAAVGVVAQIVHRLLNPGVPLFEVMGFFGLLGLAANGACLRLLWSHCEKDINMSCVWGLFPE